MESYIKYTKLGISKEWVAIRF